MQVLATTAVYGEPRRKRENLEKVCGLARAAAAEGAQLIVLPELVIQGYLWGPQGIGEVCLTRDQLAYYYEEADDVPGTTTDALEAIAREFRTTLIVGLAERGRAAGGAVLYNSAVVAGPGGITGVFRKVHVCADENHVFNPGRGWPVFETPVGKVGVLICYDLCFPEAAMSLALQGAEIICLPTAWTSEVADTTQSKSAAMYDAWNMARATETQSWFIGANQVGKCAVSGWTYFGHSRIVSPTAEIVAEVGPEGGFVLAEVDVQKTLLEVRAGGPFCGLNLRKDRRPDLYGLVSDPELDEPA